MSTSKHTPGPWEIFAIASEAGVIYCIHAGNTDIALIPLAWSGDGSNARLIAAAPELLEALREAVEACPCSVKERDSGHRTECRAPAWAEVLAKAEVRHV